MWVEWVAGARGGDAGARDELVTYFTPFVHGVLACHLATQHANEQVQAVLDDVLGRISEANDAAAFGPWLIEQARRRAKEVARTPGSTLEMPGGGAVITEGKKVLSRLRQLPETQRERLAFRLLEGITGSEIAEVTGAAAAEVRGDLERGIAALVQELSGIGVNAVGDTYLWSLVGSPHPAVVPLENQLTPLRYDPSAPAALETGAAGAPASAMPEVTPIIGHSLEVTPQQTPSPLEKRPGEGRRPTAPELKAVKTSAVPDDEPQTTPIGVKLVEDPAADPTNVKLTEEATSVLPGADSSAEDKTRNATDLPVAAKENPFAAQPSTIPASDLPVAAGLDHRASQPVVPAQSHSDDLGASSAPPTRLRPRTMETPAVKPPPHLHPKVDDPDTTAPRGAPLTMLAKEYEAPSTGSVPTPADPGQDWRTSVADVERTRVADLAAKPRPFSMTRGMTPFVIAAVFFLFFFAIAYINIRGTEQNVRRGWHLVPIIVASQSIPDGTVIDFSMISMREVPETFVTSSVVRPDSAAYVLNQRLMVPVQAGDPLLWSQFESAKANERLSRRISHRARAFTIEAEDITSVGGWVQPGDRVDLIISVKDPNTLEQMAATTLQNIQVVATGKTTATTFAGNAKPAWQNRYTDVSVLALPEEIELLALMRLRASYRMVLRTDEDYEMLNDGRTSPGTLISGERMKVLQKKRTETLIPLIRNHVPAPTR